ncbi:hypothetical protein Tco_1206382 [Tanacetum coccineum]
MSRSISAGAFSTLCVMDIALTRLSFTLLLLNASTTTFDLLKRHTNHSSKSGKPLLVLRPTHTSNSFQLGKYFPILHCLTLSKLSLQLLLPQNLCLATLEVVQTILAFPRVLEDMETSRLASLRELNLCGTQLVVAVVIDKSFRTYQQNLVRRKYHSLSVHLPSCSIRFLRLLEYVHLEPEVSHHLPTIS